jgi:hypothetical protein
MIFQHTLAKVLDRTKTQTRRRVKPREYKRTDPDLPGNPIVQVAVADKNGGWVGTGSPVRFNVGSDYAVQPGRGQKSVARIRITQIRREDVRNISDEDAEAEGFDTKEDFWHTWIEMHDPRYLETYQYAVDTQQLDEYGFYKRPTERYDAWALTFELV